MNYSKSYVVVSSFVDELIKEQQPDIHFYIFRTLQELSAHIENQAIRAEKLFISKDVLEPVVTSALTFLVSIVDNPFLAVDDIEYITDDKGKELDTIDYLINEMGLQNWNITKGKISREFINNYICGAVKEEDVSPNKRAIYRYKKSEYIKTRAILSQSQLEEHYVSEEENLAGLPSEEDPLVIRSNEDVLCKIVTLTGIDCRERTAATFLMGQYCSYLGKTVIVERDYNFLALTDIAIRSGVSFEEITIQQLYSDVKGTLRQLKISNSKLIILTSRNREEYDFSFITNLVYNNLYSDINYLIVERELSEVASTTKYTVVLPNDAISLLKTTDQLPPYYKSNAKYLVVDMQTVNECRLLSKEAVGAALSDILGYEKSPYLEIVKVQSMKLGGNGHDLHMYIG